MHNLYNMNYIIRYSRIGKKNIDTIDSSIDCLLNQRNALQNSKDNFPIFFLVVNLKFMTLQMRCGPMIFFKHLWKYIDRINLLWPTRSNHDSVAALLLPSDSKGIFLGFFRIFNDPHYIVQGKRGLLFSLKFLKIFAKKSIDSTLANKFQSSLCWIFNWITLHPTPYPLQIPPSSQYNYIISITWQKLGIILQVFISSSIGSTAKPLCNGYWLIITHNYTHSHIHTLLSTHYITST